MTSIRLLRGTQVLVAALLLTSATCLTAPPSGAATVGTMTSSLAEANAGGFCLYFPFEDRSFDVFGPLVDLGSIGNVFCSGTVSAPGADVHCSAGAGSGIFDFAGVIPWPPPGEFGVPGIAYPFVGGLASVTGSAVAALGPLKYTTDGTWTRRVNGSVVSTIPGCGLAGPVEVWDGQGSLSAFQFVATGSGSNVTVDTTTTITNPDTGSPTLVPVQITFANISSPGETVVTATSNVSGALSSNLAIDAGGYQPVFFDVSTTAIVSGPIEICGTYPDADGDGYVDGTSIPESALRILHGEGDPLIFLDRTSRQDTTANLLCASVSSLSPFVIGVDITGQTSHDNVVKPVSPVKVTLKTGVPQISKTLRIGVVNGLSAETTPHTVQLAISSSTCPWKLLRNAANEPIVPDFNAKLAGAQDTITLAGGKGATALLPLTIRAADFTAPNHLSPTRCSLTLSARTTGEPLPIDVNASNDTIEIGFDVLDKNDAQ